MSTRDARVAPHVAHLTSVHGRYDVRIYHKECRSLAAAGYRVTLVVADGLGDETTADGISIRDAGKSGGRLGRIVFGAARVARAARELDAALYHFHDPELMPAGLALRRRGKRVIFDSHEDVPTQMLSKPYLTPRLLKALAWMVGGIENWTVKRLDAVIGATPTITEKFRSRARKVANVNNYPILGELTEESDSVKREPRVCYVGGISAARGIVPLVQALTQTKSGARLELVGSFTEPETAAQVAALPGWQLVDARGFCDRSEVREVLSRSMAGLVTLLPYPNYVDALPIKMFEYMSAGVPVIASDFPLWREILLPRGCGICVDPEDPAAIAQAIDHLVSNPERAAEMGRNGQAAVRDEYNWANEERKLLRLYEDVLT